jgi:chromate reductase
MFNEDDEKRPPSSVLELKKRICRADALLIVTPEYNYSIPGVLKNAIDWACRPHGDRAWSGKAAAIMGASLLLRNSGTDASSKKSMVLHSFGKNGK